MISCKLKELLKERNRTRYWLSKETGISMNALKPYLDNNSKAIYMDTLNKICTTLEIQPGDLFEYVPDD